jgi:hypothetical protein
LTKVRCFGNVRFGLSKVSKIGFEVFRQSFGQLGLGWFARFIPSGFGVFKIRYLFFGQSIAKNFIACKIKSVRQRFWFIGKESGASRFLPTKRAADFWESAASRSIFLASSFFLHLKPFSHPPKIR